MDKTLSFIGVLDTFLTFIAPYKLSKAKKTDVIDNSLPSLNAEILYL